jgi:hypothetical protein
MRYTKSSIFGKDKGVGTVNFWKLKASMVPELSEVIGE